MRIIGVDVERDRLASRGFGQDRVDLGTISVPFTISQIITRAKDDPLRNGVIDRANRGEAVDFKRSRIGSMRDDHVISAEFTTESSKIRDEIGTIDRTIETRDRVRNRACVRIFAIAEKDDAKAIQG